MSHPPRFLIVKYVPDLERMEPRNIGVILWSEGYVAARFFGEGEDGSRLRPPPFIERRNRVVYGDWVRYWHRNLAKPKLNGIVRESVQFVDAVCSKSRDNYIVVKGGQLLTTLTPDECREAVDELFDRFVGDAPPSVKLRQACDLAINNALTKEQYAKNFLFECRVAGKVTHTFKFNYAGVQLGNLPREKF